MSSHDTANEAGGAQPKILCQAAGCEADVRLSGGYCVKRRVCLEHLKADVVIRRGCSAQPWRFCQQCGKLELLSKFEGARRSCREQLQRRRQADAKHSIRKKVPKDHSAQRGSHQKPAKPQFYMPQATRMSEEVMLWMQQHVLAQQQQIQIQEQQIKQLQALCQLQRLDMENTDLSRQAAGSGRMHEAAVSAGPEISGVAAALAPAPLPLWLPAGIPADTVVDAEHNKHQLMQQGDAAVAAAAARESKQPAPSQMQAAAAAAAAVNKPRLDGYHQTMHPLLSTASECMSAQMHSTAESAAGAERHVQAGSQGPQALIQQMAARTSEQNAIWNHKLMSNNGNRASRCDADHLEDSSVPAAPTPATAAAATQQATCSRSTHPGSHAVAAVAPTASDVVLPYWSDEPNTFTTPTAVLGERMPGSAANAHPAAAAVVPMGLPKTADGSLISVDGDSLMAMLRDLPSGDVMSMSMSMDNMTEILQAALAEAMAQQQQQQHQQPPYEGELEIDRKRQLATTVTTQPTSGCMSAFAAADAAHVVSGFKSDSNNMQLPQQQQQQQQPVLRTHEQQPLGMFAAPMTWRLGAAVAAHDSLKPAPPNTNNTAAPSSFDDLAQVLSAALNEYAPGRQQQNAELASIAAAAAANL